MSAADINAKLDAILKKSDTSIAKLVHSTYQIKIAVQALDDSLKALFVPPFGSGMSSKAVVAVNDTKNEIFSTLESTSVTPAKNSANLANSYIESIER